MKSTFPRDHRYCFLLLLLLPMTHSKTEDKGKRQLDPFTQEKLQEEIKTKIEPLLEKKLQEIVNMPGNQDLSKSQIRYLLQQSIKKIQPERFYVDKDEQAKNPSFIGYLSTGDSYLKPEEKNGKDQFTLPVNFHIPTTKRSNDLMTSSQQYPDQLYHQQQLGQVPNNNNGYPQQELILNYPNYQPSLPNVQQQFPQNYVQPAHNYIQSPQTSQGSNQQNPQPILTLQQYQNMLNQNQQYNQPNTGLSQGQQYQQPINGLSQSQQYNQQIGGLPQNQQYQQSVSGLPQNQQYNQLITGLPQTQQFNQPIAGLPIKPTTVPLAIPILQRFLERPLQPLPEQLNIQQPQQPVPLPPQLYLIPQQQGFQQQPLQGNQLGALNLQPQPQQQFQPLQQNQANGISLRADLQDNLFPQNEDRKYQQPVFSINEPPPPEEQQIENPPDQQGYNGVAQKYPLSPNQLQNQLPVNVQNLPLVNTQPVYSGQQISQQVNQGQPYYNAQGYPAQGMQSQYGPQGPLPNYQDEQQQYDRPQSDQLNAQNQGNGAVQGEDKTTETPIKYNINDEPPPISNFQDLLKPPTVDDGGTYVAPQQEQRYRNMNQATPTPTPAYNEPPPPNRLIYTTPDPQKFDDRVAGLRPPLQEQDPFMRGDPGYRPTGKPSPVVMGLRDINIIPIDLLNRNTSEKLKYDLPNDLFTLPVHFATPNKTLDYIKQKQEERLKLNSQNIRNLYDLQQANKQQYDPLNSQNRDGDKNTNTISRNELQKRDQSSGKITPKVGEENLKQRTKRHYIYEHPKIPFNLPGEIDPYSTPTTYDNSLAPSNTYLPYTPNTFSPSYGPPLYQGDTGYQYNPYPHYVAKQTPFIIILRFCPVIIQEPRRDNTTGAPRTPAGPMTTTTTTTEAPEEPVTPPPTPAPEANNTDNPQSPPRCVWATVSCCTPGRMDMGNSKANCFSLLGCQLMSDEDPCAPESLQAALNQVSAFYQNTSDALLREDRKQKFDMDYDDGLGGNDFNQLFYDDFEVPADVTVSPDSVDTTMPPTPTTPAKLVATRQAKGRTNKPAPKQTTKRPPVKVNPTKPPVKRNPPQTKRNPPNQPHKQ